MATDVLMPQMGESIAEGTITKWLVKPGQKVERDQPLFEISTDKVDAEIPSPAAGVLSEVLFPEGAVVAVLQVVARIGGSAAAAGVSPPPPAPPVAAASAPPAPAGAPVASAPPPARPAAAATEFDLVVLGSGPGGYVAAIRAAQLGFKVAVVEKDERYGGTCLLRGCIPTKALLHTAEVLDQSRHAADFGVEIADPRLDMLKAQAYKRKIVDANAKGVDYLFKKNKVEGIAGVGRLAGPHAVDVTRGGSTRRVTARFVLVATGSVPREIGLAPTDGKAILNSDHILDLERVPKSLVVLGAGAVGTEFASIFASFGSEVTLVEMLPRILPIEDEEVSSELERALRKRGIKVLAGTQMKTVEKVAGGLRLGIEKKGAGSTLEAEMLLVAVGRKPVSENLGLEALGVAVERGYIGVDRWMRTAAPSIYAIGDVVDTPWLAHVASAEGVLAVEHMAGFAGARPIDYRLVPSCTYCEPEVASVGLTEAKAREQGHDVAVGKFPWSALGKSKILGKTTGFVKVVREKKYDEVLGIHIVGPHATDLIGEACVALRLEITNQELLRTMHAHPTLSEAIAEAAHAADGHALHL